MGLSTLERTRKKYVEDGLNEALKERPRPAVPRQLSEKGEAYLIALCCSTPPNDQVKWRMQLLADRLVEVGIVDEISAQTVRRTLKKPAQGMAKAAMEHSKCRLAVGLAHGRCAGAVCRA